MGERFFVIWSFEHDAWWAPICCGYTRDLSEAGRYSEVDATEIVMRANRYSRQINELMMPLTEAQIFVGTLR